MSLDTSLNAHEYLRKINPLTLLLFWHLSRIKLNWGGGGNNEQEENGLRVRNAP